MRTGNATSFCKQATCPASETLLSFREAKLGKELDKKVAAHLTTCDFCGAELQLLAECPSAREVSVPISKIPISLRRLAEELLAGSFLTVETFNEGPFEKERLTLTDA